MRSVFADTSYWIAVLDPKDYLNAVAETFASIYSPEDMVTSVPVLMEVLDAFADRGGSARRSAAGLVRVIQNGQCQIGPFGAALFEEALALYTRRPDKSWSFTDCSSFVIMSQRGLTDALTYDRHFEQAGFKALLRT